MSTIYEPFRRLRVFIDGLCRRAVRLLSASSTRADSVASSVVTMEAIVPGKARVRVVGAPRSEPQCLLGAPLERRRGAGHDAVLRGRCPWEPGTPNGPLRGRSDCVSEAPIRRPPPGRRA